jgi:hypothetical protein
MKEDASGSWRGNVILRIVFASFAIMAATVVPQKAAPAGITIAPVTFDVNKACEDLGHVFVYVGDWISRSHNAAVANAVPDIVRSLTALAAENRHIVGTLKPLQAGDAVLDASMAADLEATVTQMHQHLREFNNAVAVIPGGAVKPKVLESLFSFQDNKREMLRKLDTFSATNRGTHLDPAVLKAYIKGLTQIAQAAEDALAKIPTTR